MPGRLELRIRPRIKHSKCFVLAARINTESFNLVPTILTCQMTAVRPCFRYTPEELHAMVDLKPDKKDDD